MDELTLELTTGSSSSTPTLLLATIASVSSSGITLKFAGQSEANQKLYKRLITGQALYSGDRVLVVKMSGTYVVLGKIAYS